MTRVTDLDKINLVLEKFDQKIRIESIDRNKVILSNGRRIETQSEIRKIKRRITNRSTEYLKRFDEIYGLDIQIAATALSEAKSETSRKGGLSCQAKHGDKIKNNLNIGVPWNKDKRGVQTAWNKGITKDTHHSLAKLSIERSGSGNPMHGKTLSDAHRLKTSKTMQEKILRGEFTPNSNNRNTHWKSTYDGKKYRSSWEALYQSINKQALYESLRLQYEVEGKTKIYIVDFVDHISKQAIEVKPRSQLNDRKTQAKLTALESWCANNGYQMIVADENYLTSTPIPDKELFDPDTYKKIEALYEISE